VAHVIRDLRRRDARGVRVESVEACRRQGCRALPD
jgi:hypothetical protein